MDDALYMDPAAYSIEERTHKGTPQLRAALGTDVRRILGKSSFAAADLHFRTYFLILALSLVKCCTVILKRISSLHCKGTL